MMEKLYAMHLSKKKQNIKFKEEFFYKKTIAESDAFERIYAMKNFTIG